MGRIFHEIEVNGNCFWTLFDSGARSTYVVKQVSVLLPTVKLYKPVERRLGGKSFTIEEFCPLVGAIEGYGIAVSALIVNRLFPDEYGRPIEIIFGAEAMELWGRGIDMANKRLDFTYYAQEAVEG